MTIDHTIISALANHLEIAPDEITADQARKIIIDHPINLVALLLDDTQLRLAPHIADTEYSKLAIALNYILIHHFSTVEEMLVTLNISERWIHKLWAGLVKKPKKRMITKLIKMYEVDPLYLYADAQEIILSDTATP